MSASSTWCPLAPSFPSVSRAAVALRWGRKPYETGKKSASKTPPLAWGLLLGAPALTEAGLAPAGDTQRADAGLFGHPPSASRRTMAGSLYEAPRGSVRPHPSTLGHFDPVPTGDTAGSRRPAHGLSRGLTRVLGADSVTDRPHERTVSSSKAHGQWAAIQKNLIERATRAIVLRDTSKP